MDIDIELEINDFRTVTTNVLDIPKTLLYITLKECWIISQTRSRIIFEKYCMRVLPVWIFFFNFYDGDNDAKTLSQNRVTVRPREKGSKIVKVVVRRVQGDPINTRGNHTILYVSNVVNYNHFHNAVLPITLYNI